MMQFPSPCIKTRYPPVILAFQISLWVCVVVSINSKSPISDNPTRYFPFGEKTYSSLSNRLSGSMTTVEKSFDVGGGVAIVGRFVGAGVFLVGASVGVDVVGISLDSRVGVSVGGTVGSALNSWVGAAVGDEVVGDAVGIMVEVEEARRDGLDVGATLVSTVGSGVSKSLDRSEGVPVCAPVAIVGDTVGLIVACRFVATVVAPAVGTDEGAILGAVSGLNDDRNEGTNVGFSGTLTVESACVGATDGAFVDNGCSITMVVNDGDSDPANVGEAAGVIWVGEPVAAVCDGNAVGLCGTKGPEGAVVSPSSSLVEIAAAELDCSSSNTDWLWK